MKGRAEWQRPGPVRSAWLLLVTVVCVVLLPSRAWADDPTPTPSDSTTAASATVGTGPTDTATATTTTDPSGTATSTPDPASTATPTATGGPTATDGEAAVSLDPGQFTALAVGVGLLVAVGSARLALALRGGS